MEKSSTCDDGCVTSHSDGCRRAFKAKIRSLSFERVKGGARDIARPEEGTEFVGWDELKGFDRTGQRAHEVEKIQSSFEGTNWLDSESVGSTKVDDNELSN